MGCLNLSADAVGALDDLRCLEAEPQGGALLIPVSSRWRRLSRWWAPEGTPTRPGCRQNRTTRQKEPMCASSPCRWSHRTWRTDLMKGKNTEDSALLIETASFSTGLHLGTKLVKKQKQMTSIFITMQHLTLLLHLPQDKDVLYNGYCVYCFSTSLKWQGREAKLADW